MATMKLVVAFVAVCSMVPIEAKVQDMWYFHKTLASMFSESCSALVPDHSGIDQLKEELKECFDAKSVPEPGELKLKGVPVGLENSFPGEYLYASSYRDDYSKPQRGRLNLVKSGDLNGAWCAEVNNDIQFFQADLGSMHKVTGIITQGDHNELNWVRSYILEISSDGLHWSCVFGSDGRVKVFTANLDSDTPVTNVMHPFIHTRYIRIVPKSWTGHICLRAEIYVFEIRPRDNDEPEPIPDFETKPLDVNPKAPKALIVKSYTNQVDRGVVPEEWTEYRQAPIKSISYGQSKDQPQLFRVNPALETQRLNVNPKDTLIVKNGGGNQINTGMLPAEYTDENPAPSKTISFEFDRNHPELRPVRPAGVAGAPLNPLDTKKLVITGGGPIIDHHIPGAPGIFGLPIEVSTFGPIKPKFKLEFGWHPSLEPQPNMFIEFSFERPVPIRGVRTIGISGLWITIYQIAYLPPGSNDWLWIEDKTLMEGRRIEANDDDSSPKDHIYSPEIFTSRIRLYILEWHKKPAASITLYLGAVPRDEAQILSGPVYTANSFSWAWDDRNAEEGATQELFLRDSFTLQSFDLDDSSTIETYKLQYLVATDQWRPYADGETQIFSRGEGVDFDETEALGLKIIVLSWQGEGKFFGQFSLEIKEDASGNDVVADIIELTSRYINYEWEDSAPAVGSGILFDLKEEHQLTRIVTIGLNGAWVSKYTLECRDHKAKQGSITEWTGNSNDVDIVEHKLNLQCKYVIIRPVGHNGGIGMKLYLYSDEVLDKASVEQISAGGYGGSFDGDWSPPESEGDDPVYLEFSFNHHITITRIAFEAMEGSEVRSFEVQISDDGENYESVLDNTKSIREFSLGNYKDLFLELRGLRIFLKTTGGNSGFSYSVDYRAERKVKVEVKKFAGEKAKKADPRATFSGNFKSDSDAEGQYIRIEFPKAVKTHQFTLNEFPGSDIANIKLEYKENAQAEYQPIEEELPVGEDGASLDLRGLKLTELRIEILGSEGGVKFEYSLELSGSVSKPIVSSFADDAKAAADTAE